MSVYQPPPMLSKETMAVESEGNHVYSRAAGPLLDYMIYMALCNGTAKRNLFGANVSIARGEEKF
jgi:hypothetical protein